MSDEEYSAIETEEPTRPFVKSTRAEDATRSTSKRYIRVRNSDEENVKRKPLFGRLSSFQSRLRPNFGRIRGSFRKLNCFKSNEEEAIPMMDVPRHKSIDIGVGLARKMSLFIFTRRTVCVHPYHPYTPAQTTRKLHFCFEEKDKSKHHG